MTTGHFALAAGVRPRARTVPLWALMLSTYLLDVVFMALVAAGVESFAPMDPTQPTYGRTIIHAGYSHSLLGALVIALLAGILAGRLWGRRGGVAVGAVTFSHWLLDLVVHRPDLPLLPGNAGHLPLLGLGLWDRPALSLGLELVLVVGGLTLYYLGGRHRAPGRGGRVALATAVTGILLLLLLLADAFAWPMTVAMTLMLALVVLPNWLDRRIGLAPRRRHPRPARSAGAPHSS